jgi:hypothetical protein
MKRTHLSIVLIMLFSVSTLSSYAQKKENRVVGSFTSIGFAISGELYLTQGSPQKVVVEGDEADLEKLVTEVKDGALKIKCKPSNNKLKSTVKVWVTVPEINSLAVAGSGKVIAEGEISSDDFDLSVSGSGKINFANLNVDEIEIAISGSGDIMLAGGADAAEISISGSGDVEATGFEIERCDISISGSGSCRVNVVEELEAAISGSGKVYYKGRPKVNAHTSGSGKVESID